jgi:hypothetical protein
LPVSFLRLERVVHWERIASAGDRPSPSHLINADCVFDGECLTLVES